MKSVNKISPKIRRLNDEKEIVSLSSCRLKLLHKRLYINISILYGNLKNREVAQLVQHHSKANRDGNRVPAPWVVLLWPLHGVLWCNWSSVPLVCLLQVNSMLTSLLRGDGGAGGWRGEKTTGLAYRQGSRLERGEETMWCSVFFLLTWLSSSKKILHCSQTLGLWGLTFSAFQWHCLTVKSHAATGHQGKDPGNKYVRK